MAYVRNSLPTRVREAINAEYPDAVVTAKQNYRMDITHKVTDEAVGGTPSEQLSNFSKAVMDILAGMDETFAQVTKEVQDDTLFIRIRAVDYVAPVGAAGKHSGKGKEVDKEITIQTFIDSTIGKAGEYFGDEVKGTIANILHKANDERVIAEEEAKVVNMFKGQFSDKVASRMAELLKQVLAEEEAAGVAPEDSNVLVNDGVQKVLDEVTDVASDTIVPNTKSRRNSSR